jgi:hypothetical protein
MPPIFLEFLKYFALSKKSVWVAWPLVLGTVGAVVLAVERERLFMNNLFDVTGSYPAIVCDERALTARTADGTCNDLSVPGMGAAGVHFGRNVNPATLPAEVSDAEILSPNPRDISRELLTRDSFKPAESLNFIAAAWIQFMIHDWFSHGANQLRNPIKVPLRADDPLVDDKDSDEQFMKVRRTARDEDGSALYDLAYRNENTHWWDGSQIYGSDAGTLASLRTFKKGQLRLDNGRLPKRWGRVHTGFSDNWWLGLSLMHTAFVREHNAIAAHLAALYPAMKDQELFDKARLINSAVMAKIHTVEWTPAILNNPVLAQGMYSNWFGLKGTPLGEQLGALGGMTDQLLPLFGVAIDPDKMMSKALNGIIGGPTDHYGVPYTLTEEFVSVYRMHPLVKDSLDVYNARSKKRLASLAMDQTREQKAELAIDRYGFDSLWYSFGITHPGALTLNNYPGFLQNLKIPMVGPFDLGTVDIIRDRERGVPRYNEFRRQLGLKPIGSFRDLFVRYSEEPLPAQHAASLEKLERLYHGDVEKLDLMIGCLAESIRPDGYGFGETAFQVFTLMASRRLLSDRFFTVDYRPEVYTQAGLDWVKRRTMKNLLEENFPGLPGAAGIPANAFQPWVP